MVVMATKNGHAPNKAVWELVVMQHGVIARWQLLDCGFTPAAIRHRLAKARLYPIHPGVYAVGRPELTRHARWMAALLACGRGAVLSNESAAALWALRDEERTIEVSVPRSRHSRPRGIRVHRRHTGIFADATTHDRIPVTSPIRVLVDLAVDAAPSAIERMINQADKLDLIDPEHLRSALRDLKGDPGVPALREILDLATFTLTDSELERRFLPIARKVGLPKPKTREYVNGFRVDFYWPDLGLVVETDGLRYHRTPTQQARHTLRDNAHLAAGLTPLRFTHAQVRYGPKYVEETLATVARGLHPRRNI